MDLGKWFRACFTGFGIVITFNLVWLLEEGEFLFTQGPSLFFMWLLCTAAAYSGVWRRYSEAYDAHYS